MHIGFIGLGIMGKAMAMNLLKAGFTLTVYNRTAAKCGPLVDAGAAAVSSPRDAAKCSDIVVTVVSDTPDVEAVLFGDEGIWQGLKESQIVIDMSSISPAETQRYAARLRDQKV